MALSGAKPYERIKAGFKLSEHLQLTWFTAQLDEYVEYEDTVKVIYNRYLAGHRAELNWKHFQLGMNEFILYGGIGRQIELYYLLPLYALHGEQLNHRWDDNTLWSVDAKLIVPPFRGAVELIVDDFQIDSESEADREPSEYGFALKGDAAILNEPLFLTVTGKYEMVTNLTFNQNMPYNRYLYENEPLGAEDGNDYEKYSLGLSAVGSEYGGNFKLFYLSKGEGRIDDKWAEPWVDDPDWTEKFPSGIVEKYFGIQCNVWGEGFYWKFFGINMLGVAGIEGTWKNIDNYNHVAGEKGTEWELKAEIETKIWGFVF